MEVLPQSNSSLDSNNFFVVNAPRQAGKSYSRIVVDTTEDGKIRLSRLMTMVDVYKALELGGLSEVERRQKLYVERDKELLLEYNKNYEKQLRSITGSFTTATNNVFAVATETTYGTAIEPERPITMEESKMTTRAQAEALAAQAAEMLAELDRKENLYGVDNYENGTILYLDSKFIRDGVKSKTVYNFAIVKANSFWYVSGPVFGGRRFTWDQLIEWFEGPTVFIVRMGFATRDRGFIKNGKAR